MCVCAHVNVLVLVTVVIVFVPVTWVGLFRQQPDFRIQVFFRKQYLTMALRCVLSVNSHLSGFSL